MRILGFMSGTSLDGVDAAILSSDGEAIDDFGPTHLTSFSTAERAIVKDATEQFVATGTAEPRLLAEADDIIVSAHVRRSEEHTSEPVTNAHLVCRLLLEKKKNKYTQYKEKLVQTIDYHR